jgi:RNA polymerase sigma factor (sigma-70 family)
MAWNKHKRNSRADVKNAARIISEHSRFIRSVISSQISDKAAVDDIFQNFFLSLVARPVPENVKDVRGYLYRAVCNDIVDNHREILRYKTQMKKYRKKIYFSINNHAPENALINEEQLNKMFELIKGQLTSCQFQAIDLHFRGKYSIEQIAEKMGVKVSTVSRYIWTGIKRARQSL